GRGEGFRLSEGDWVEYVDDRTVLLPVAAERKHRVPDLFRVESIDSDERTRIKLSGVESSITAATDYSKIEGVHPFLRRWDQRSADKAAASIDSALGPPRRADDNALWLVTPGAPPAQPAKDAKPEEPWLDLEEGI